MITKKDHDKVDDLTEEIAAGYKQMENNYIYMANVLLFRGLHFKDLESWKITQAILSTKDLIGEDRNKVLKEINKAIDDKLKDSEKILGFKVEVNLPNPKLTPEEALQQAAQDYQKMAFQKIYRNSNLDNLYDAIFKQTQQGIEKGLKVAYVDGRQFSFKSYMEMKVRTEISTGLSEEQLKAGQENSIVFYLCNSLFDCAHDHADYQGLIYYDQEYLSFDLSDEMKQKIADFIQEKNMMSLQQVRDNAPFLTTRPNCRHVFTPLTIAEAMGESADELLEKMHLKQGKYDKQNYDDSQHLRYCERNIRAFKDKQEYNRQMYNAAPPEMKHLYMNAYAKDNMMLKKWQKEATDTANKLGVKRDRRRESNKLLMGDMGAKYMQGLPKEVLP